MLRHPDIQSQSEAGPCLARRLCAPQRLVMSCDFYQSFQDARYRTPLPPSPLPSAQPTVDVWNPLLSFFAFAFPSRPPTASHPTRFQPSPISHRATRLLHVTQPCSVPGMGLYMIHRTAHASCQIILTCTLPLLDPPPSISPPYRMSSIRRRS